MALLKVSGTRFPHLTPWDFDAVSNLLGRKPPERSCLPEFTHSQWTAMGGPG